MKHLFRTQLFVQLGIILLTFSGFGQPVVLNSETFESASSSVTGIWTMGTNASLSTTFAHDGSRSMRFQSGGTTSNTTLTSSTFATLGTYDKIDIKFFLFTNTTTAGDYLELQYRPTSSSSYVAVRRFTIGSSGTPADINDNTNRYAFIATMFKTDSSFGPYGLTGNFRFVASLSGSNRFIYIDNLTVSGTIYNTVTQGPGGISTGLETWLRADRVNGTTVGTDNANLATWRDCAKGHDASVMDNTSSWAATNLTRRPVYNNNSTQNMNFNPVVYFGNDPTTVNFSEYTGLTNRAEMNGTGGFFTHEQFVVFAIDYSTTINSSTPIQSIYVGQMSTTNPWDRDTGGFAVGQFTGRFSNEVINYSLGTTGTPVGYGVAAENVTYTNLRGFLNCRNTAAANGLELFLNGTDIETIEVGAAQFVNSSNRRYWLGRSQVTNGSLNGRIAECITYSSRLSTNQRSRVESYLAIKYGVTLGVNGTSQHYVDSSGSIIWNIGTHNGYNFNIAGIGRDDAGTLNQKQSRSANSGEVVTVGLGTIATTNSANTNTFATDRSFLMWGSNNGTIANATTPVTITYPGAGVFTSTDVINRRWKFVETGGEVSTARVSIPTTTLSSLYTVSSSDAYVMVVADNAAFTSGVETVFMSVSGSDLIADYDFDGAKFVTFGVARGKANTSRLTLDGTDDYVRMDNVNELGSTFSVMSWIRPNGANTLATNRTIIAKRPGSTSGYRISLLTSNRVRAEWTVSGTTYGLTSNTILPDLKWRHICFTYNGATLTLYIDGVVDSTASINVAPVATTANFAIGAEYASKSSISNYFRGDIDELRIWNKVLTVAEIRFVINQEIAQNGTATRGTVLPTTIPLHDISGTTWGALTAYYSMNNFIGSHISDDSNSRNRGFLVANSPGVNAQTAPLPYTSASASAWTNSATWTNGSIVDAPSSVSIVDNSTVVGWNIVQTSHNITSNSSVKLLGLFVNSNTLSAATATNIEVSHYLLLSGKIDLVGQAQLVQTTNSELATSSGGSIERDQQGTKNVFNYNYWSSPVSTINTSSNNNGYTLAGVLRDGTTPSSPASITWTTALNGSATSPITLSDQWIYTYNNANGAYSEWIYRNTTGTIASGLGFTLKGSGAASSSQNYVFVGKPNNGTITLPVTANNLVLCGNPYPSALDAVQFIKDNISGSNANPGSSASLDGTLYFWQQGSDNGSHVLASYTGRYASMNLLGSVTGVVPSGINGLGGGSYSAPKQYIPVGQGFFVQANTTGGNITFKNSQRIFKTEDDTNSTYLLRTSEPQADGGSENPATTSTTPVIKLGFNSVDHWHRQIAIGFDGQNATDGFDYGYDSINFDDFPSDMNFLQDTNKLVIQGVGDFALSASYPLTVKSDLSGVVRFEIDELENFDPERAIYLYDDTSGTYYDLKQNPAEVTIDAGTYDNRFFLRFLNPALGTGDHELTQPIKISYLNSNGTLVVHNNTTGTTVKEVHLFNIMGQQVGSWKVEATADQTNIVLPVSKLSTGAYIAKVTSDKGTFAQKVAIR